MKKFFKDLSEKENGSLQVKSQTVETGIGERSPCDEYDLEIEYSGQKISIRNEIGVSNIGSIFCKMPIFNTQFNFSVRTRSHFFKLFKKDKKSFIIKCKDPNLLSFISNLEEIKNLEILTLNTQFEVYIYATHMNNRFEILTEYNLIFENRKEVLTELIQFYKKLIKELIH